MRKINKIYLHCSDSEYGDVILIDKWHRYSRGWDSIGYHYVALNGYIYNSTHCDYSLIGAIQPGRNPEIIGAHVYGHNDDSLGYCLIGKNHFAPRQLDAVRVHINYLLRQHNLKVEDVVGHYEVDQHGKTCPNINMISFREYLKDRAFIEKIIPRAMETAI